MSPNSHALHTRITRIEAPPFARSCMDAAGDVWGASFGHPFVRALADGSLDPDRFRFYQMQDARYLEAFADACSLISVRCSSVEDKMWFIEAARLALVVEGQLHGGYGEVLGYDADDIREMSLSPNNKAYQDHMISAATRGSLLEAVAAMTPCPWLYTELGAYLLEDLGSIDDGHPYAEWLRTYADEGFVLYTKELLAILQRLADGVSDRRILGLARDAFVTSARYEWMFWEQAWLRQEWSI